jgi:hypothetical protein
LRVGRAAGRSSEPRPTASRFRTSGEIALRFTRLGETTAVEFSSEFVETAAGRPVEASVRQGAGARVRYVFRKGDAGAPSVVVEREGAKPEERALPKETFLAPRAAREFIRARQAQGADAIRYRMLDPQSGLVPVDVAMKRKGAGSRDVLGRKSDVVRYEVENSLLPVPAEETLDGGAMIVESTTPMGLGDIVRARGDEGRGGRRVRRGELRHPRRTFVEDAADRGLPRAAGTGASRALDGRIAAGASRRGRAAGRAHRRPHAAACAWTCGAEVARSRATRPTRGTRSRTK